MGYRQLGNRQGERQVDGQAGRCAFVQVGIQVGRQASFEPAEGRLQKLVRIITYKLGLSWAKLKLS